MAGGDSRRGRSVIIPIKSGLNAAVAFKYSKEIYYATHKMKQVIKSYRNSSVHFLFEALTLTRLKRTGWQILGAGNESIADHTFMVCMISLVLCGKEHADRDKVLLMALFHDFSETRTGDIYKLSDLYVQGDSSRAFSDAIGNFRSSKEIISLMKKYEKRQSMESQIVHDADVLALCIYLKTLIEKGNTNAKEWLEGNKKRLFLQSAKDLYRDIIATSSQEWWKKEREKIHKGYKK